MYALVMHELSKRVSKIAGILGMAVWLCMPSLALGGQAPANETAAILSAAAAASPSAVENAPALTDNAFSPEQRFRWLQEQNKRTELIGLVVAMIVALLIMLFFIRTNADHTADELVRASGLVLVIFGTLFMAVYASTADQLTAPIGILGAIVGYLFGSAQRRAPGSPTTVKGDVPDESTSQ
jgi:hypothetical protein